MSSIKETMQNFAVNQALKYVEGDPETNIPKLVALAEKMLPAGWYEEQFKAVKKAVDEKSNWYQLILKLYELDPGVRKAFFQNFLFNASLKGSATQKENREKYSCNIPWAILLDPTSACNLHCTGCWAAEYGNRLNLSLETIDSIIRRGKGIYDKVANAMRLLQTNKLPFGISTCYTSVNYKDITSEEFFDYMVDSGALFTWFFHYMPVGNGAVTELLPTPSQREEVCHRIRAHRNTKPLFTIDFQNDAEYVHGCIAGGRNYLHINAKGDVEPCVFIHNSNCNIHDTSLLDALRSPLFMAYHDNQPFNENMLQPCPMLENPEKLRAMVKATGAVNTDYQSPESVDHLCDKTTPYAENWKPTAEKLWRETCASCGKCK